MINKSSSNTKINLQLDLLSSQVDYDPSSPSGLRHSFTKGPVIKDEIAGSLKTVNGRPEAWSVKIKGRLYTAARVVWILQHGNIDDALVVDHIDRNVSNNDISNLRLVSVKDNNANRSIGRNNKTGVNGVQHYFHQGFEYYTAYVSVDGKSKLIYFSTKKLGKEQAFLAAVQCRRESEQKASICQK